MDIICLDLYKRESQLCVLTEAGEIIESGALDDGCWAAWRVACAKAASLRFVRARARRSRVREAAVGDDETEMPVGQRAVGLLRSGSPMAGIPLAVLIDIRYY